MKSLKSIGRVFRYELRRQGRRSGYLLTTIGLPLLALVLFYGVQAYQRVQQSAPGQGIVVSTPTTPDTSSQSLSSTQIGVVDQSGLLSANANTDPLIRYASVDAANSALQDNTLGAYYLISSDYLQSGNVELWMNRFNINNSANSAMRAVLTRALAQKLGSLDSGTRARLTEKAAEVGNHRLSELNQVSKTADFGSSFILVYGFALTLLISTFMTSGYLMQSVMEEKENRIVEVLISSMRPSELLAGKVLSLGLLGLIQMGLWGATAVFLIKQISIVSTALAGLQVTTAQIVILLVYFLFGYLMFAAVYAGIGAIANNLREGPQLATFFTIPALLPLYLIASFTAQPDSNLAVGLSLFPVTAPIAMIMRVAISPVPAWQIGVSLVLLLLTGIAFMWIAGRLFRVMTLLAGQSPKIGDIPRLLRQSM